MKFRLPHSYAALLILVFVFQALASGGEAKPMDPMAINEFIARWERAEANELANAQLFTSGLMELLGVGRVDPSRKENHLNKNAFERHVQLGRPGERRINGRADYYLAGHLALESKQSAEQDPTPFPYPLAPDQMRRIRAEGTRRGTALRGTPGWDLMMEKAREQAENYAYALPAGERCPPLCEALHNGGYVEKSIMSSNG